MSFRRSKTATQSAREYPDFVQANSALFQASGVPISLYESRELFDDLLMQDRLYDCVEIACEGHLVRQFPESAGKPAVIRLDCFETPNEPVRSLIHRFETHVRESDEWRQALAAAPVASLVFEYNWRQIGDAGLPAAAPDGGGT
jgi:hypothetical protein